MVQQTYSVCAHVLVNLSVYPPSKLLLGKKFYYIVKHKVFYAYHLMLLMGRALLRKHINLIMTMTIPAEMINIRTAKDLH